MATNHEAVAAMPMVGYASKGLLRGLFVKRYAYVLTVSEDLRNLVAIDPDGNGTIQTLGQNGLLYALDDADATTAHDGVTCLVSNDGKRYKLSIGTQAPFSVLSKALTAPPASPTIGDSYIIYGSPTGAWAGNAGAIAIYTARGWSYATAPVGFLVFVIDETAYYHRDSGGAWQLGTGSRTLGNNSVVLSNAVNFGKRIIVENQTTTAPPASPTIGTAYIIGPAATGSWAGQDGKIAICEVAGSFTIYTPSNGWAAYDKAQNNNYNFNGTAWVSAAGAMVGAYNPAAGGVTSGISTTTATAGSNYSYNGSTAPTQAQNYTEDDVSITYTAKKANARLRFVHRGNFDSGSFSTTLALFRDAVSNAVDWYFLSTSTSVMSWCIVFETTAPDTSAHTYKFRAMTSNLTIRRRVFTVEEFA